MAGFNFDSTTSSYNAGLQKTVFREVMHPETFNVPTLGDIKIIEKKNIDRNLNSLRSFLIKDPNDDVVSTLFRSDDEDDPIFYYVPFRGKEYIFTSKTPYHLTIVNVTDKEEYSKKLIYDGYSIMPRLIYIYIGADDKDILLDMRALCSYKSDDGNVEFKNKRIIASLSSLDIPFKFNEVKIFDDTTMEIIP